MKKIFILALLISSVSMAAASKTEFSLDMLSKTSNTSSSLISVKDQQINFNWCTYTCRREFSACLAQPDPYNINLDLCRIQLDNCLQIRCNQGGINF